MVVMAVISASLVYGQSFNVSLKAFLEGPFSGTAMGTSLNSNNYLPLTQPYNTAPWNYPGTESVASIPNADVVDWVLVELRETAGDASTAYTDNIVATQAGFLLKNGNVVSPDGTSPLHFSIAVSYKLYAVVYHRNHLAVLSGNELINSGGNYSYDFTTGAGQVYGGANGHKEVVPGIWAMIAGDGDANGQVNNADKNDVWKPQSGNSGYRSGDFSMNGQVDNVDKNDLWKINSGKSSQVVGGWSCGKAIADTRDGQLYTTVQIGSQCWFKENLNIGTMIPGTSDQTNNQVIEKYCQENNTANCDAYGGLYQWDEMMQYVTSAGAKGICPDGWHLPTDAEWCGLEQSVDPTITCGSTGWRGIDGGTKLKQGGSSGFEGLMGGYRATDGSFAGFHSYGIFFTSSEYSGAQGWARGLFINDPTVDRNSGYRISGFSVRCLKNPPPWQCGDAFLDTRDNQSYTTVQIGSQCWMAENLNTGAMVQGNTNQTNNGVAEKYCYDNNTANCDVYGGLYQWDEMMQYTTTPGVKGICPDGWHLPEDGEWTILADFLGGMYTAGGKMKTTGTIEAGTGLWYAPNTGATNSSGFSCLPAGNNLESLGYYSLGLYSLLWSSSQSTGGSLGLIRVLSYNEEMLYPNDALKESGLSVRCVKNPPPWQQCGDPLYDSRNNQSYTTVQIGDQCWMAENLNIGTMIQDVAEQTNNGVIEKYCQENSTANCDAYGGLYQWDEMMQYLTTPGVKGICPDGWHLPTDAEWCELEQAVDPTITCESTGYRGIDGGTRLKQGGSSGFEALLGGWRAPGGTFWGFHSYGIFFTSSEYSGGEGWVREFNINNPAVSRGAGYKVDGFSVRCVKNALGWGCGDLLLDTRDYQTYSTVQIGSQCWMAENLNIGTEINGMLDQTDNGVIEKYCYDNNAANCDVYGGLYQWSEMMQYATTPGVKGICPDGWHLPTDAEYCTLTQFIDPTVNCSSTVWSGTDVGTKMKSTTGWYGGINGTNSSGFTALPGGKSNMGGFISLTNGASFWSSTESGTFAWNRGLYYSNAAIYRSFSSRSDGLSVRCVKNPPPWQQCGDVLFDTRDNQNYSTVQIGSQCWMAENLNIGTMINGSSNQTNNAIIEKYCNENSTANCDMYGGLYQWNEMMQYVTTPGVKGVCPDGWHLPTDAEYCTLAQFIDPAVNCSGQGWSGTEVGTKMKSETGWYGGGNGTNASGFTALPGGHRDQDGIFIPPNATAYFWSSSVSDTNAWYRRLHYAYDNIYRDLCSKSNGNSVRCVKNTPPWQCGDLLTDPRNNQNYTTVQIGAQCWMAENLNIGSMVTGTSNQTNNGTIEKYCYDNSAANCDVYGGLYQWNEMMQYVTPPGVKGICPDGWHLPTDAVWCVLEQYVDPTISCSTTGWRGVDGGGKLKEAGTAHWYTPNTGATNSSGFTALPGGYRNYSDGSFGNLTYFGDFWCSTASGSSIAWRRALLYENAQVHRSDFNKNYGFSVRCLQN